MEIKTSELRTLRGQRYNPVETTVVDERLDHFSTKEFREGDVAELFHENTKITLDDPQYARRVSKFTNNETMWLMLEHLRPDYENHERIELPSPAEELSVDLSEALLERESVRSFSDEPISARQLSTLLRYGCGTSGVQTLYGEDEHPLARRTYPSGGGLYPVEIYLAVTNAGEGLTEGLYYYVPDGHYLRRLQQSAAEAITEEVGSLFDPHDETAIDFEGANLFVLLTGAFWRSKAKYGARGYRFVLQESGHLLQNLLLAAGPLGLGGVPTGGYHEDALNEFLDVDGVNEAIVYAACLGATETEGEQ